MSDRSFEEEFYREPTDWEATVARASAETDQVYAAMRESGPVLDEPLEELTRAIIVYALALERLGVHRAQIAGAISSMAAEAVCQLEDLKRRG